MYLSATSNRTLSTFALIEAIFSSRHYLWSGHKLPWLGIHFKLQGRKSFVTNSAFFYLHACSRKFTLDQESEVVLEMWTRDHQIRVKKMSRVFHETLCFYHTPLSLCSWVSKQIQFCYIYEGVPQTNFPLDLFVSVFHTSETFHLLFFLLHSLGLFLLLANYY